MQGDRASLLHAFEAYSGNKHSIRRSDFDKVLRMVGRKDLISAAPPNPASDYGAILRAFDACSANQFSVERDDFEKILKMFPQYGNLAQYSGEDNYVVYKEVLRDAQTSNNDKVNYVNFIERMFPAKDYRRFWERLLVVTKGRGTSPPPSGAPARPLSGAPQRARSGAASGGQGSQGRGWQAQITEDDNEPDIYVAQLNNYKGASLEEGDDVLLTIGDEETEAAVIEHNGDGLTLSLPKDNFTHVKPGNIQITNIKKNSLLPEADAGTRLLPDYPTRMLY